ncbi:hypothetical protein PRABACTJOHN_03708 [Parabacteroides johnsonii DSM 18315]|uniref:Uncharacterized protein n=1 Tax=Parabacteroides johnsonii DSM 18315 TaxID=537006 RepID=B7BF79_9BACT|nr:hypothetical protein PRABACTJOHN_03708 [Parabacteroides johnsonii DSM 18315]
MCIIEKASSLHSGEAFSIYILRCEVLLDNLFYRNDLIKVLYTFTIFRVFINIEPFANNK